MADLRGATQDAIYDKLLGNTALTTLLATMSGDATQRIWQHGPDEIEPPFVLISDISSTNEGGKDGGFDRMEVQVLSVVREPGREHLTPVMTAVRDALDDQVLVPPAGVGLSRPVIESEDDTTLDDGITYVGDQRFSLFAQPA